MGNNIQTFEVRVAVKKKGSIHFSSHVGMFIENSVTRMFHVDARTGEQAMRKCEKHGRPLSCRKVDTDKIAGAGLSGLLLPEAYGANNPYPNAVAMDEMVWRKKSKRAERIESLGKDKDGY